MPAKTPEPAKVMDVTHPKNVQPSVTSRPVLVPSRPMIVADPMIAQTAVDVLTKGGAEKSAGDPTELIQHTPELVIGREAKTIVSNVPSLPETPTEAQPSAVVEEQPEITIDSIDSVPAGAPPVDSATAKNIPNPSIVITEPAETNRAVEAARTNAAPSKVEDTSTVSSASIQQEFEVSESEAETEDAADEDSGLEKTVEQKQTENIEKLIASRLYAVPIGRRAKRRAHVVLLIACTLLLALIALDLLLDMDIVNIPGIPHTTFFSL